MSEDQAVTGEDRAVEPSLADEVAKDYPFIQMMADLAGEPVEKLIDAHRKVCEYIGSGMTPAAALGRFNKELLDEAMRDLSEAQRV